MEGLNVQGTRGALVMLGLGDPLSRGIVAAALGALVAFAIKLPSSAFTDEGDMRPFKLVSVDPQATYAHFLIAPVAVGTAAYLFT